jgi:methyl-accepting chemotaxis protein
MAQDGKTRLFRMLRRAAAPAGRLAGAGRGGRNAAEENALWLAHERAGEATRGAAEAAQQATTSLAKGRSASDAALDRGRALLLRSQEATARAARLSEVFERLGLVALNAGLEGSRLGEGAGRPLSLLSDEVRTHAARGGDLARELGTALGELAMELSQLQTHVERAVEAALEAAQATSRATTSSSVAQTALGEIGERVKKTTGSDPETARTLAEAAEHARHLVTALGTLSGKAPRGLVMASLRPVLEPLLRLLDDDDSASAGEGEDEGDTA